MPKFNGPVVAVELAVRVNEINRNPAALTVPPAEENVTPLGSVPVWVIVSKCGVVPVFSMHAYFV